MRRYSTICPYSSEACTAMYAACVQRVDGMIAPDGVRSLTLSKAFASRERPNRLVIESKRGLKGSNNLIFARQLSKRGWINIGL